MSSSTLKAQNILVGDQSIESNIDSNAKGLAEAFPATASASGQIGSINVFLDETSTATKIYLGVYADSGGKPGSLLTQGSITQFALGTWNTVTVSPANVTSGTSYWIAILGTTSGTPVFRDRSTTSCHSVTSSQSTLTSLPASWSTGKSWNTCYISAYVLTGTSPATVLIGDQAVEGSLDKNPAGRAEAFPAPANATGTVGAISLYLDPTSGSGPVYVGLYADNGGHPGALLGQGSTTEPVAGSWNQITISPASIAAGNQYWIAVLGTQSTSPYFRDRTPESCHSETTPQSNLTSLPATWTTGTIWTTCYISAYGLPAATPTLSISPANISFNTTQPGPNPAAANLSVTNTGGGTLNFSVSTDASWLSASPASGTAPQTVQVSATLGSLGAGTYTGHVTVTAAGAQGSPAVSTVTFTVAPDVPPSIVASISPAANANGWNNLNVTVSFTCAAGSYPLATCTGPIVVSTEGANQSICGNVTDTAGYSASACATVSLDKTPPTITAAVTPAPVGGINYGSATVTFTCSDALSGVASCPSPITDTTIGPNQVINGTATDKAGNSNSASVTLNIQSAVPPAITATASPLPNTYGWNNTAVTVTFSCTRGTYAIQTCPSPIVVTQEGAGQSICGTALDTSGLSAAACATVSLDETPPTITATAAPPPNSNGWNNTTVNVTFTCSDGLSGIATCPSSQAVSTEGANQSISGTATDKAGNSSAPAQVTLNIDVTPPSITGFTAPTQLSPGESGTATLTATDDIGVVSVVFALNGTNITTLTAPPYSAAFNVPGTANAGDTLTLTATVYDEAGNVTTATRGIQVVPSGVVVGQILSALTGLPLSGATISVAGGTAQDTSDASGRYSIPVSNSHLFLTISMAANPVANTPAMVTVEREVYVQQGVGTVPVDARLTQIAAPVFIGPSGGTVGGGTFTVNVPSGAVGAATNFYLTPLSQQGIPALLPLGWSPIASFDLRSDTASATPLSASFTALPSVPLNLVTYSYAVHAWMMVASNLIASNGSLSASLPSTGSYALVTPDPGNTAIQVPAEGQPLGGVPMVAVPTTATTTGTLSPANVSPAGGTSTASLAVQSPTPLPSGTVLQAKVAETYSLTNGSTSEPAPRFEDIVVYQVPSPNGAAAAASFPVTPSQTYQPEQITSGNVHLDILAGRESVRGSTGGSNPVSVQNDGATLAVASGSLPEDTAIAVSSEAVDGLLPSTNSLTALAEYNIDFSGQVLNAPAQLTVPAGSAQAGATILLALEDRVAGVPYLVAISLAQVNGSNLVTQATPGFPGITQGGDYVFYQLNSPIGFVSGTVTASSGPVAALVQTDGLPFVAFPGSSGSYTIPALAGAVTLTATVPNTALEGTASVQVTAGQTSAGNITVTGQVESATITPPNGALGVPLTAEIDVTAPDAFNPATVTASSILLMQNGTSTPIPVRFVFAQDGTRLSVFPQNALQPSTSFTFTASGLANMLGGLIAVPTISFTTQAVTPPSFNTNALVFGMPDQSGNVQVSAPANSFPPGTTILIVDQTSGVVVSLTVANDGSVSGQFPATIDDTLAVTITAPDKTTASFTRSQFVAADGTTAIGPGGGSVTGPGNLGMIIPQGALNKGTTFKLALLDQTAFPKLPSWGTVNFGSGMQITAPAMPSFTKEVKLAFPVPANAPAGAFYYVFRRLTDSNNNVLFETIDQAFVQGTGASAQVVTASPPFCGYMNSFGNFQAAASGTFEPQQAATVTTFMMWDYDPNQAGIASPGLIAGRVYQNDASGNLVPLAAGTTVTISLTGNPQYVTTTTDACGTYSLFDPQLGGGPRSVTAYDALTGQTITTTADEVNGIQPDDPLYSVTAGLENQYRDLGRLNFTFASPTPPPPPPQINIGIYTLDANGNRQPISGIVQANTPLTITFASTLSVVGATFNGAPYSSVVADTPPANPIAGFVYTRLNDPYTPGTAGSYTVVATAANPLDLGAAPVTMSRSFLVVAGEGQGNQYAINNVAPVVVGTVPSANAQSVSTSTFPQITFNEPVVNVPGNITLAGSAGDSPTLLLIGIRSDGSVANPVRSTDAIVSLTLQPLTGLQFGDTYTLTLTGAIVNVGTDQNNNPIPQLSLSPAPYILQFTTFGPEQLGGTSSQYQVTTRPVIIGQRAYAGELVNSVTTGLGIFDITDPSNPVDKGVGVTFVGRGTDITGLAQSPVTGGPLVAISAGTAQDVAIPGNVWLYDVSSPDTPKRMGAVSVSSSATQAGVPLRLAMKDNYLYAFTFLQGLQVVDLLQAINEYKQTSATDFGMAVTTEGEGFATDAVVNTIPLPLASGGSATMFDLQADDFATSASGGTVATQTLLAATGQLPFVMTDPTLSGPSAILYPSQLNNNLSQSPLQMLSSDGNTAYQLVRGQALALGTVSVTDSSGNSSNKHIAVVVGSGRIGPTASISTAALVPVLAVIDLTGAYMQGATVTCDPSAMTGSPNCPAEIGFLQLPSGGTDVTLNGSVALVATGTNVLLVNLENPSQPSLAGQITGNFGNWLALADTGILLGTSPNAASGGIQASALGSYIVIQQVTPEIAMVDDNGNTTEPIQIGLMANGQAEDLQNGQIIYTEDGSQKAAIPVGTLKPGSQTVTIPPGMHISSSSELVEMAIVKPDGTETPSVVLSLNSPSFAPPSSSTNSTGSGQGGSGQPAGTSSAVSAPSFDSLSPLAVAAGSGDTTVTVSGIAAGGLAEVFVRGLDSQWNTLSASSYSGTSAQFTIPAALLSQAGFLEVAPTEDDTASIPLMVYDPGLPTLGSTSSDLEADFADSDTVDTVVPDTITVMGSGFTNGNSIVVGRGNTPGVVFPTTFIDSNTLQASVPAPFALEADDLFAAVLSTDGITVSAPVPLPRAFLSAPASADNQTLGDPAQPAATIGAGVDPLEVASAAHFQPNDIGITSVQGYVNTTIGAPISQQVQTLYVCGVNFVNGLLVNFRTFKGGSLLQMSSPLANVQSVATMPPPDPTVAPQSPTSLLCGTVGVPLQIPDSPMKRFRATSAHAQGTSATVDAGQPPRIPFGGRRQFGVYQDPAGSYRILALSEAKNNPLYRPASGPVLSVVNPVGSNTIQLERESGDTQSTTHIRATGLSQLPCSEIQKELATPPSCDSSLRPLPYLQAVLNGTVVASRNVESTFATLGSNTKKSHPEYDGTVAFYADMYGVPPQFLKAQAIQESGAYKSNFRFEFTSINLTRLAGDGNSKEAFSGSQPLIQTSPFSLYLIGGNALRSFRPGTQDASRAEETQYFPYDPQDTSATEFGLGVAAKRTIGAALRRLDNCGRNECAPAVTAWIQDTSGAQPKNLTKLTLVHRDTIWQRDCLSSNGKPVSPCSPTAPLVNPGVDNLAAGQNTLQPSEFAIDYGSGTITTGAPLGPSQQLKVTYWPVGLNYNDNSGQPTVVPINAGSFATNGAPNLNDRTVANELDKLQYNPGEKLFDFLKDNVANDSSKASFFKPFLTTVSAGDSFIEFTVDANNKPVQPRDPRYQFMTSQPYASSSYGFLQLTLLPFGSGSQLTATFDPSAKPIYNLMTQPATTFDLAGHFHRITLSNSPNLALCAVNNCNESLWEQEWTGIFLNYNKKGVGYADGGIIKNGATVYAPQEPQ